MTVLRFGPTAVIIVARLKMATSRAMAFISGLMGPGTKASGWRTRCQARVILLGLTAEALKAALKKG